MKVPPPAFVWPRVEEDLRRRKKRYILMMWCFGVMLLLGVGVFWISNQQNLHLLSATTAHPAKQILPAPNEPATDTKSNSVTGVPKYAPKPAATTPLTITEQPKSFSPAPSTVDPSQLMAFFSNTSKKKPPIQGRRKKQYIVDPKPPPAASERPIDLSANPEDESTRMADDLAILDRMASVSFKQSDFTPAAADIPLSLVPAETGISFPLSENADKMTENDGLPVLDKQPFQTLQKNNILPVPKFIKPKKVGKPNNRCYNFAQNANIWFVDAYTGPSYNQKLLRSQPDNRPYLNQRLNTERRDLALNAGLRASFLFQRFYVFRTGIHYDQSTEIFEYADPDHVLITTRIRNVGGKQVIDTLSVQYGSSHTKIYNRLGTIDIPLLLGAELRKGNTGFSFNGGALINIAFWKRGQILDPATSEPAWYNPKRNELAVYQNHAGVSIFASAQWFCHLQPRLRLFIEPYFREVLRPVTLSSYPVEQRHRIWGLQCGVTRILDKKK